MKKFNHKKILSINSKQIECIERQYWLRYNNNVLESMLNYSLNTKTKG